MHESAEADRRHIICRDYFYHFSVFAIPFLDLNTNKHTLVPPRRRRKGTETHSPHVFVATSGLILVIFVPLYHRLYTKHGFRGDNRSPHHISTETWKTQKAFVTTHIIGKPSNALIWCLYFKSLRRSEKVILSETLRFAQKLTPPNHGTTKGGV